MELTLEHLFYVGLIASAFTQALRLLANWRGFAPSDEVITLVLWVLSIPVAISFAGGLPDVITTGDPAVIAQSVLTAATTVLGSATIVYHAFMKRVFRQPETE